MGRAWPLRAAVLPGRVPTWKELMDDVIVPCIGALTAQRRSGPRRSLPTSAAAPSPAADSSVATSFLNDPEVRKAIHARPVEADADKWAICTDR